MSQSSPSPSNRKISRTLDFEVFLFKSLKTKSILNRYTIGINVGLASEGRLPIGIVVAAFTALQVPDMDADQVECILANLIYHVSIIKQHILYHD